MNLQISSSPHIRDDSQTRRIMLDVIIALAPALLVSVYFFGLRSLAVIAVTVAAAVLTEYCARKIMKRNNTLFDLSAVVTGILLAMSMPPTIPYWICIIGSVVAIGIVKQMYGGIGSNFVNPAIAARIVLAVSFPAQMNKWTIGTDLVSTATPLDVLRKGTEVLPTYWQLFIGDKGGCIGEISVLALLIGAAYLIFRKVIKIWIPLSFIATTLIIVAVAGKDPLFHVLSGGLVIGAFFMATDYVTSPLTNRGKIIFGIGCGVITGIIRLYSGMAEGVSFSILIMNIVTPHIDNYTIPVSFGGGKKRAKQED
ncbi:MAG: RnfABCDGE type electron transport complex subunit D [Saccharofermentanales bacterium]